MHTLDLFWPNLVEENVLENLFLNEGWTLLAFLSGICVIGYFNRLKVVGV